jgi:hypothetical protein
LTKDNKCAIIVYRKGDNMKLEKEQLERIWEQLDGACEALERLAENGVETGIDFSSVVSLKNEVEKMIDSDIKEWQKAKAIASDMHDFEDGAEIIFIGMALGYDYCDVYKFKGIVHGEERTQDLVRGEFKLI